MYTVTWDADAEQDLAALWMAAADRTAVTKAADRADRELKRQPLRLGKARGSSVQRFVEIDGLGIEFEVIEDDKRVLVHNVFAVE